MNNKESLNVLILTGGFSAERSISLDSCTQVVQALTEAGHKVRMHDIFLGPSIVEILDSVMTETPQVSDLEAYTEMMEELKEALDLRPEVVFPVLHGQFGEDGQLQEILEKKKLPYVGSSPTASRLCTNKVATKTILLENNIPTPNWQMVYSYLYNEAWTPAEIVGYPFVVKPLTEGSSIACDVCKDQAAGHRKLSERLDQYGEVMVEQFIDGPELSVGIVDGVAVAIAQIVRGGKLFDYEAKYCRQDTGCVLDIDLPQKVIKQVRDLAELTHAIVGARHISQVDFMVDKTTQKPYVLEINTIPKYTKGSLFPTALAFPKLCDKLVRLALRTN